MAVRPRLGLAQRQSLALTPGLKQSIEIMQLSAGDLAAYVERKLEENPFLARGEASPGDVPDEAFLAEAWSGGEAEDWNDRPDEGQPAQGPSLETHLLAEARLAFARPAEQRLAVALIAQLDDAGYLPAGALVQAAETAGLGPEAAESVLARLQALGPPGLFARSLKECLALQLAERGEQDEAFRLLLDNLPLLAAGDRAGLLRRTGLEAEELDRRLRLLRGLDPKPALSFEAPALLPVVPDLQVLLDPAGRPEVTLNPDALPRVRVDLGARQTYRGRLRRPDDRRYYAERSGEAGWLVRALARRGRSLLALGQAAADRQAAFFQHGLLALRPLTRRELAQSLSLSEATVSRLVANKHFACPLGIFPLARLFSAALGPAEGGISAAAARQRLAQLIAEEPPGSPLSDAALALALTGEGMALARRTVAKYRESLQIPPAFARLRRYRLGGGGGRAGRT